MELEVKSTCNHDGVVVNFDEVKAQGMNPYEVRKRWPRFFGKCPDCNCNLIKYASMAHFVYGDW
jgi:hypothetical protein